MDFADQNYQFQWANTVTYWDKDYSKAYGRQDAPTTSRMRVLVSPLDRRPADRRHPRPRGDSAASRANGSTLAT